MELVVALAWGVWGVLLLWLLLWLLLLLLLLPKRFAPPSTPIISEYVCEGDLCWCCCSALDMVFGCRVAARRKGGSGGEKGCNGE